MYSKKVPEFLRKIPRPWKILAPMVTNSDEAFRMLVKKYKADLCYTEMVHCRVFNETKADALNNQWYTTSKADRPLVIQICGNDPDVMLETCLKIQDHCDAIDINFGCPQEIARKGNYGSWLMKDIELVERIVTKLSANIKIPLFCKIRVFEDIDKTVEYAKMIEKAGCALLTVHGRTREQRGQLTGYVSYEHIKAVKAALEIPVITNGGVLEHKDIKVALEKTNCDGVMIAEPILFIPTIFEDIKRRNIDVFMEYLDYIKADMRMFKQKYVKAHAFKILKTLFDTDNLLRNKLADCNTFEDVYDLFNNLKLGDYDDSAFELKPNIRSCYLNK